MLPVSCDLCPRRCGANRRAGETGLCGVAGEILVARAALHEWEEPCISCGAGSGTIFFSGCPLRCVYCQNYPIAHKGEGLAIDTARLMQIFFELEAQGAANINLVSPTPYAPFIIDAVRAARKQGLALPMVYNSSGYEMVPTIESLSGIIDIYLVDVKYGPASQFASALRYSHAADYFERAFAAIEVMVAQVGSPRFDEAWPERLTRGVIVRHLLLPGALDEATFVMGKVYERFGDQVLYSIMSQYTPCRPLTAYPELAHTIDRSDYERLLDHLDARGLEHYFWQQGDAAQESFIPSFDHSGVLAPAPS